MGTGLDWIRVVIAGAVFGGLIALSAWMGNRVVNPSRLLVTMHCLQIAFCALGFGVVDTFGARAFRPPLLTLLIVTVGCVVVLTFYARKLARRHARVPDYSADKPLLGRTDQQSSDKS